MPEHTPHNFSPRPPHMARPTGTPLTLPAHPLTRRQLWAGFGAALLWAFTPPGARAAKTDKSFARDIKERLRALSRRADDTRIACARAAAMSAGGKIIAEAHHSVRTRRDPTAHAAIIAVQTAARMRKSRSLGAATLYTSGARPCAMCETAAYWAGVSRIVSVAADGGQKDLRKDHGAPRYGGC